MHSNFYTVIKQYQKMYRVHSLDFNLIQKRTLYIRLTKLYCPARENANELHHTHTIYNKTYLYTHR